MSSAVPAMVMRIALTSMLAGCVDEVVAQAPLEAGSAAEITEDGLHRVDQSVMDAAWVKPGLDLTPYRQILVMPAGVSFRSIPESENRVSNRESRTEYPLSDEAKIMFRRVFEEAFEEDFAAVEPYELSKVPGRDVLMVQGFLVDFVSGIPPERDLDPESRLTLRWEATIILELRDSMSNEMLARTVERERFERLTGAARVREVGQRLMGRWSRLLRTRLEELTEISGI